ncbi:fibrinogen-like protein 1 [Littorina saxatilis]|uniref:Fibrinogen C-terminal domain-containing protein n=1 Tax=Littorina saxatilis TaxID=31220 RepID=A0AAN9BG81_9CAEN
MVLQRRSSTPGNFNRTWKEYVDGFEEDGKDFWLGLQNLYIFTNSKQYDLNVNATWLLTRTPVTIWTTITSASRRTSRSPPVLGRF